jgi:hypothetical protein
LTVAEPRSLTEVGTWPGGATLPALAARPRGVMDDWRNLTGPPPVH